MLEIAVALGLGLGLLPSIRTIHLTSPELEHFLGPVNFLKLSSPFLCIYLTRKYKIIPAKLLWIVGIMLGLCIISTVGAGVLCGFPPMLLREAASICLGMLAALCFHVLPEKQAKLTICIWVAAIIVPIFLDIFIPDYIDWLYAHIFDPATRNLDQNETGRRVLTGIYGRQSLAKIMILVTWVTLAYTSSTRNLNSTYVAALGCVVSGALVLYTSQRGPFVANIFAWLGVAVHIAIRLKQKNLVGAVLSVIVATLIGTILIVPKNILLPRARSMLFLPPVDPMGHQADWNRDYRRKMLNFSWGIVKAHPLGHACIGAAEFSQSKFTDYGHSHNLFMQQARDRGWLWGAFHLALWAFALIQSFRAKTLEGAFIFGAVCVVLVEGLFDHLWQVLNHSMLLSVILIGGLNGRFLKLAGRRQSSA